MRRADETFHLKMHEDRNLEMKLVEKAFDRIDANTKHYVGMKRNNLDTRSTAQTQSNKQLQ